MRATDTTGIEAFSNPGRVLAPLVILVLAVAWAVPASAVSVPAEIYEAPAPAVVSTPMLIGNGAAPAPLATLAAAESAAAPELAALYAHNLRDELPMQDGFTRSFPAVTVRIDRGTAVSETPRAFAGGTVVLRQGRVVWSGAVEVTGAYALRLHLQQVSLPQGTAILVADSASKAAGPYGAELLGPDGDIWLPAVFDHRAQLEVQVDPTAIRTGQRLSFQLGEVAELVDAVADTESWTDCDLDATCIDSSTLSVVDDYREAVAHLRFMDGGLSYICSGGLVADTVGGTPIPYLLTANHCISTQASASSLSAFFDYKTTSCDGSGPPLASVPRVNGSTLLATNSSSDFTLLQLSANPTGTNYYLGWDSVLPTGGTTLHRISHPNGTRQKYSAGTYLATGGVYCPSKPRPNFLYTHATTGSTFGGSSGGPVIRDTAGGQIVGQLYGTCSVPTWDDCSYGTFNWVDGAFATTYQSVESWLNPPQDIIFQDGFESGTTSAWSGVTP